MLYRWFGGVKHSRYNQLSVNLGLLCLKKSNTKKNKETSRKINNILQFIDDNNIS